MVYPWKEHWVATKHVLRCLRGTLDYALRYLGEDDVMLYGYMDSNWEGSALDKKSKLGCFFNLGSTMIFWFRWKQTFFVLNLVEVEYMVVNTTSCEDIWLYKLLARLFG